MKCLEIRRCSVIRFPFSRTARRSIPVCKRYPKASQAGKAHAHLQNEYNINVTLGGTEEE